MALSVFHRFLSILGGQLGSLILGLTITPLLVRVLTSSQYGDYAVIMSMLSILILLVNAGIFDGIRKYIPENRGIQEWEERVFGFYLRLAILIASIAAVSLLFLTATGVVSYVFDPAFERYFYVLSGLVVASQLRRVARGTLMGFGQENYSEPLEVLDTALFGLFGLSLAYLGHGVVGVLLGKLLSLVVVLVLGFGFASRHVSLSSVLRSMDADFPRRELVSFNGLSIALALLMTTLIQVDILLLQPLSGSEQTGYYKAALVIAEFIWFVPATLQTLFLQATSEMWTAEKYDRITRIAARTTRYSLLLTLLMAIGLVALADTFVPIYFGHEYVETTAPLLLLLPGTLGFALARPIFAIGQGKGDLYPLILATSIAAVLNFLLNLFLIPRYGMHGAAVATSIGYGSMFFLHVHSARHIGFDPLADLRLPRILATAALTTPVIFVFTTFLPDITALIVVPVVGFVTYFVLAIKTAAIDPEEAEELLRELPGPADKMANALKRI